MQCPLCQHENPAIQKFCGECGTSRASPNQGGSPAASYADLQREVERLTRALNESLEQQTATSEILRVISSSPTDVQPVLDAVAESAARLCEAPDVSIFVQEADHLRVAARHGPIPSDTALPLNRESGVGWAVLAGRTVHVADMQTELDRFPISVQNARRLGFRTALNVPLIREGVAIGAISLRRAEAHLFAERQVALLETFADQAVIAIENVRLFKELEVRNRELTETLEQQTATAEVLRIISTSPTELQPVLEVVVKSAVRFCGADDAIILRLDAEHLRAAAHHGPIPVDFGLPVPCVRGTVGGRSVLERRAVHVTDLQAEAEEFPEGSAFATRLGARTTLGVSLLREGAAVGTIQLRRAVVNPFTDKQIALLQTFADQAVIAIENVRLFTELQVRTAELEAKGRQLEAASRHKSEFLANMSHELRTPLNAVIGFSEVLAEKMFGDVNDKQAEYLQDILESGRHLLSLINDILDLSKIEAGRMELELSEFDLPHAIENALTLVRERALRRGIALHQIIDDRVADIRADDRKVKQVLLNLLSNAIKFTPEGGRIEVRAAPVDGTVEVSVTDTGVGIAPEDQEAVFEEFRQVGTADKRAEGSGLGLALCRKFVELHGGTIWVTSSVGVGSTFTFRLPVRPWPARSS